MIIPGHVLTPPLHPRFKRLYETISQHGPHGRLIERLHPQVLAKLQQPHLRLFFRDIEAWIENQLAARRRVQMIAIVRWNYAPYELQRQASAFFVWVILRLIRVENRKGEMNKSLPLGRARTKRNF